MVRFTASLVGGALLVIAQAWIVMALNGYDGIQFRNYTALLFVWMVDVALVFSALTQLKPWLLERQWIAGQAPEED